MRDNQLVYKRNVSSPSSWLDFSIEHVAFAIHRITGWLLLGWVVVHLGLPAITAPSTVWTPMSTATIVALLSVFVFHALNGVRLLVAELAGVGTTHARQVFQGTLVLCVVLVIVMGGLL